MAVRVVTDSTADLPPEMAKQWGITVVPLNVHFGDQMFKDGVTITVEEFFRKLATGPLFPSTSQPSVGEFLEVYKRLTASGDHLVSIHISDKMSGTLNSARQAKEAMGPSAHVEIIDSMSASIGVGFVALEAAKVAHAGGSPQQVADRARDLVPRLRIFFVVDTLEYLAKGGRISKAKAFLGNLLNVKPILVVKDGEVGPLEQVRTRERALDRLAQLIEQSAPLEALAVVHATTPADAISLADRLKRLAPRGEVVMAHMGAVIGTHTGPGTVGALAVVAR
ncbi:MAG: DegV family protein [Chloroflexota bacterium]|nr:DegV family protein [Chloroflexota bacterium]